MRPTEEPTSGPIGVIRAAASTLLSRSRLARHAGITYGGKRDLYEVLGYSRYLNPCDYRERYQRQAMAARIVEALPFATWRTEGDDLIVEDEDPKTQTAFEKAFDDLNARLNVWTMFQRTDIVAGLGRYAVLLLGFPTDTTGDLSAPITKAKPQDLTTLTPFSEEDALIQTWDTDPQSDRFGLPELYSLNRLMPNQVTATRNVHWSRVIHVADGLLDDHVFGLPRLERIWNLLDDLEKVTGGGAEAFWIRANQGLHLDVDKDMKFAPGDETLAKLREQMDEYEHGLRRVIRTRGVSVEPLGSDVANFSNPVDAIISQISAGTGIPQRILMGSERGQLASTQDKSNYDDRVQDRRTSYANTQIVRPFIDRLISFGVLPEPKEYHVQWPTIKDLAETERAAMAVQWAGLNTAQGDVVVTAAEIRDHVLELPPFTTEQLAAIEKQKQEALQQQQDLMAQKAGVVSGDSSGTKQQTQEPSSNAKDNAPGSGKKAVIPKKAAPKAAIARALDAAIEHGQAMVDTPALRAAIALNDRGALAALLEQANVAIEAHLTDAVADAL